MQQLRSKRNHIITTILFSLIILSFIIWGGYQLDTSHSPTVLTTVNGEEIPFADFQRVRAMQLEAYGKAFGGGNPLAENLTQLVERQVASGLVMQTVMSQQAKALGIVIGEEELLKILKENKNFFDPEKQRFSPSVYKQVLEMNNLRPAQYEESLRKQLMSQRLQDTLENSLFVSPKEIEDQHRIQGRSLSLETAVYTTDSLIKAGRLQATDDKLKSFYEARKGEFLSSLRRNVTIAKLSQDDLLQTAKPQASEIEAYWNQNVKTSKDSRWNTRLAHAYHILISEPSAKGAERLSALKAKIISQGGDLKAFIRAAQAESEDYSNASKGGDLGYFDDKAMVKPFGDAIFKTGKLKSIIGPVKTDFGHHLIWIEDLTGTTSDLKARTNQIAYELTQEKATQALTAASQSLSASLAGLSPEKGVQDLKAKGFKIFANKAIDAQTRDADIPFLLIQEALQADLKKWVGPKEIQGQLYALIVNDELKPEPLSFADARKLVEKKFISSEAERLCREDQAAVKAGQLAFADLAKRGATIKTTKTFKPFEATQVPDMGESEVLLKAAQALNETDSLSPLLSHEGKWIILRASQFAKPSTLTAEEIKKLKQDLLSKKKAVVMNDFIEKAVKEARIPEAFKKKYNL